jgi:hypothetical protein
VTSRRSVNRGGAGRPFASLLAIFSRTAGRVSNTVFAWATIALFGHVPAMKARARLAERLAFSKLYMTWTADRQRLENKLRKI